MQQHTTHAAETRPVLDMQSPSRVTCSPGPRHAASHEPKSLAAGTRSVLDMQPKWCAAQIHRHATNSVHTHTGYMQQRHDLFKTCGLHKERLAAQAPYMQQPTIHAAETRDLLSNCSHPLGRHAAQAPDMQHHTHHTLMTRYYRRNLQLPHVVPLS